MLRSGVSTSLPTRREQNARGKFSEEHVTELTEPLGRGDMIQRLTTASAV